MFANMCVKQYRKHILFVVVIKKIGQNLRNK